MTTATKTWKTCEEMKGIDWSDAALSVNKSRKSGLTIIVRRGIEAGSYAVLAVDGALNSILSVMGDKWHAINWARKCAAQGWI